MYKCIKVLNRVIAFGSPNDANMLYGSLIEAPSSINISNGQTLRTDTDNLFHDTSMHETNITIQVVVQKKNPHSQLWRLPRD